MSQSTNNWWRALRVTGQTLTRLSLRWARHEWDSLQGHRRALAERLSLARSARSIDELIGAQVDLFPESRRRLQRNAETRQQILTEAGEVLRGLLRYQRGEVA